MFSLIQLTGSRNGRCSFIIIVVVVIKIIIIIIIILIIPKHTEAHHCV